MMRFMVLVKASERFGPPPRAFIDAVEKVAAESRRDGSLGETGGLAPSAAGARVRVAAGKVSVTDGPFTEAKEIVGGFGMVHARSREEAVDGVRALMELHRQYWPGWEGEAEVRQIMDQPPH